MNRATTRPRDANGAAATLALRLWLWFGAICVTCALASPCPAATARGGNVVMGTVLEIVVVAEDPAVARALVDEAFVVARHWDNVLTTWRSDGELARLNAAAGNPVEISGDLSRALARMKVLNIATAGAFDPAVGPLVERSRVSDAIDERPAPEKRFHIRTALDLLVGRARLLPNARIDSGGIGKGMALDAIAARLDGRATAYYLDFGGSSQLAAGRPEDGRAWRVIVSGNSPRELFGSIALDGASISTSRALATGDAPGTIIDPFRLVPVAPPRLATVVASDAATAEAWSTALVVLGPEGLPKARRAGVQALIQSADGTVMTDDFPLGAPR